ncbi:MAG: peptidase M28, partial [Micromonosporaceae bacterium]
MRPKTVFTALITAAMAGAVLNAPPAVAEPTPDDHNQSPQARAAAAADLYVDRHAGKFLVSKQDRLVRADVQRGGNGLRYVSYQRTYRGLPVVGGDAVVVTDASGSVLNTALAQKGVISVDVTAAVSAAKARDASRAELATVDKVAKPRLVVLAVDGQRLAWETVVTGATKTAPSKLHVFVDATTGKVVNSYDEVKAGTGNGYYNGNVSISTSGSGTSFSMADSTRSGIRCGGQNGATYTGSDDVWGNGAGTDLETACVDALYAVQKEWDMLGGWLGRSGINGNGGGFPARVGLNDVNAY